MVIPSKCLTKSMVMQALAWTPYVDEEMILRLLHLLDDEELVSFLIERDNSSICHIPKQYLKSVHYEKIVKLQLSSDETLPEVLPFIPDEYLTFNDIQFVLANTRYGIEEEIEKFFKVEMLPYFLKNGSSVLPHMPTFMIESVTKENMIDLLRKNLLLGLKMPSELLTQEVLEVGLNFVDKDNKGFKSIYLLLDQSTNKSRMKEFADSGFYSTDLFDDLVANNVTFNPVKMYRTAYKSGSKKPCLTRIFKHFSLKEIHAFYDECNSIFDRKTKEQVIKDLRLDRELEEEFLCPCCNKPLPQDLIDKIRGVQNND